MELYRDIHSRVHSAYWTRRRDSCMGLLECKHTLSDNPTGAAEVTLRNSYCPPELHIGTQCSNSALALK